MPARARSADARISPEVRWYLKSRDIPHPTCPPTFLTPDPSQLHNAQFDPARVDHVVFNVLPRLRHTQGKFAGRPLRPDPWQVAYILAPVFGWVHKNEDGDVVRVIRRIYVDIPRKNGKTTTSGGIATHLTCSDGEPGAQVYAVAAGKEQARYCFDPVKLLAEKSPELAPYVKATASRIVHRPSGSYFAVASSVADLLHGANIHGGIIDELHVHKTADVVEAVESGTGSRRQPLILIITTADDGRPGTIYDRRRTRIEHLAAGALTDPSTYGVIWAAELDADPFSEKTWRQANPGLGISPTLEFMQTQAETARQSPADLASFMRLHLGIRTKLDKRYLDLKAWDSCAWRVEEAELAGRECFGGLDLASTTDLCALAWDFPDWQGGHDVIWRVWAPEDSLEALNRRTAGAARVWVDRGLLLLTPGNIVDYDFIRAAINRDRERFAVREIAYDPWNATQLVTDLVENGATMVPIRQGFGSLSPPTKELKRLLLEGLDGGPAKYRHGENQLLRWVLTNFAVAMDAAGNVKPDRASSRDKIDPLAAAVMALDRAMRNSAVAPSVYETQGIFTL